MGKSSKSSERNARLRPGRRTALAAGLVTVGLAAPLVAWFIGGHARAEQQAAELLRGPDERATATARELAARLSQRLEELRERESQRPFYHYQNLYHDPRGASVGSSVIPSPLATQTGDLLVRGHFQIDAAGRVSLPVLNDEVPELVTPELRATGEELRAALDPLRVAMVDAAPLSTDRSVVAAMNPEIAPTTQHRPRGLPRGNPESPPEGGGERGGPETIQAGQTDSVATLGNQEVAELDWSAYSQNANANQIYRNVRNMPPTVTSFPRIVTPTVATVAGTAEDKAPQPTLPPKRKPVVHKPEPKPAARIIITTDPLQWHTFEIGGARTLVALRQVGTPDGRLTQGFVVSADALTAWLGEQGSPGAGVNATGAGAEVPVAGGAFHLVAPPPAEELALARAEAAAVKTSFYRQFFPIAGLAVLLGLLVVLVVSRSERDANQRSLFAASAAHELRTPLAGMAMYGEMLAEGLGDPKKTTDYARRVANEAARLGRVVGNVLGFTQLERGALKVRPRPGDLGACVEAAVERARAALAAAGATLELDPCDDLPEVCFDSDAVAQILHNLIDNAEKYTREAKDRTVRVVVERDGSNARVSVIDRGPGLPPSTRRLFRPFQRAVGGDGPAGLGLGLALCRALARAQDGELAAAEGPGGRFVLTLPLA